MYCTYSMHVLMYNVRRYISASHKYLVEGIDVLFFAIGDEDLVFREWESDLRER